MVSLSNREISYLEVPVVAVGGKAVEGEEDGVVFLGQDVEVTVGGARGQL